MLYLNKLLNVIKQNPLIFKSPEIILILGINSTQIKELKKFALENHLIEQSKQGFHLTNDGEKYLSSNPVISWKTKDFPKRPEINLEYLKEEKTPAVLTKAIRNLAKHLIEKQDLKEFTVEHALSSDTLKCKTLLSQIERDILDDKRNNLERIFEKYLKQGLTKSLIGVLTLLVLTSNTDKIAIYEKGLFQLKFDTLMFDRMIACPQNFEIQKTEMTDEYLLKDISKIILNQKSNNILEITKGLYKIIKSLDKYTMNTQNLTNKTLRFRNIVVNAKDPISLFEKDIPKVLANKKLEDCNREFLDNLKATITELKNCTSNLVKDLENFILDSFHTKSKEELAERFLKLKEYIGEKELKILLNNVIETNIDKELWTNRIATFINKHRVPKDWNDEDYTDFKIKIKELALKLFVLESTIGTHENPTSKKYETLLKNYLVLPKHEQLSFLRKAINA